MLQAKIFRNNAKSSNCQKSNTETSNPLAPACQGHPAAKGSLFLCATVPFPVQLSPSCFPCKSWSNRISVQQSWSSGILVNWLFPPSWFLPPTAQNEQDYHPGGEFPGSIGSQEASKSGSRALQTLSKGLQEPPRAVIEPPRGLKTTLRGLQEPIEPSRTLPGTLKINGNHRKYDENRWFP